MTSRMYRDTLTVQMLILPAAQPPDNAACDVLCPATRKQ